MFIYCLLEAKSDTKFWEYNDGKTRPPTYKGSNPEERVEDQRYFANLSVSYKHAFLWQYRERRAPKACISGAMGATLEESNPSL